jgi:hypothetical protein
MSTDKDKPAKSKTDALFSRPPIVHQDRLFYAAQPKLPAGIAEKINSRMTGQLHTVSFEQEAYTYASNLERGLAIEFEHIMGFFVQIYNKGYILDPECLDQETLLHMSHWAHEMVQLNFSLKEPYHPDKDASYVDSYDMKYHHIPNVVLVLLMYKAKTTLEDNSFYRAFYRAFYHLVMAGNNKERNEYVLNGIKELRKVAPGISHALVTTDNMEDYDPSSCDESHGNDMKD